MFVCLFSVLLCDTGFCNTLIITLLCFGDCSGLGFFRLDNLKYRQNSDCLIDGSDQILIKADSPSKDQSAGVEPAAVLIWACEDMKMAFSLLKLTSL